MIWWAANKLPTVFPPKPWRQAKLSVTVPTLVIGLFDRDENGTRIDEWDIRALGITLEVAQNKNGRVAQDHEMLVQSYIDTFLNQ